MDKFNDMWKNRFNDGNMPIADWNTPDDEVWDAILPHVVEKKKRRFIWWFVFLFGGLATLFLVSKMGGNAPSELSGLLTNDESFVEETMHTTKRDDFVSASSDLSNNPPAKELKNADTADNRLNDNTVLPVQGVPVYSTSEQTRSLTKNVANKPSNNSTDSEFNDATENDGNDNLSQSQIEIAPEANVLAPAELLPMRLFMLTTSPVLDEMPNVILETVKKKRSIDVGLAIGAMFWNHQISGAYQNDLAPFDFNYSNNVGSFISAQIGVPINNRWRVFTGLQLEQVTTTSGHNSSIEYDKALENAALNNDYDLGLATPYGISDANFVLDRDIAQPIIEDTVSLLVDFHSSHQIKNLHIPLGVEAAPWGNSKSIFPSFIFGGGFNYITQINNELDAIDTHHGAIAFNKEASQDFAAPVIQRVFFDVQLGLKTSISLSRTLDLNLNILGRKA